MRQKTIPRQLPVLALVALALTIGPAAGAERLATMNAAGGSVYFAAAVPADSFLHTVSGGGYDFRREFKRGETLSLALVDDRGAALPDGTYTWELRALPSPRSAAGENISNERGAKDGSISRRADVPERKVQSGAFTIRGGAVADPNLAEADAGPYNR